MLYGCDDDDEPGSDHVMLSAEGASGGESGQVETAPDVDRKSDDEDPDVDHKSDDEDVRGNLKGFVARDDDVEMESDTDTPGEIVRKKKPVKFETMDFKDLDVTKLKKFVNELH